MIVYGRTSAHAIAVMSYLAGLPEGRLANSAEIAAARGISKALTAKLLTQFAAVGLVNGQPGPGGGYKLGRDADQITLFDIVSLHEPMTGLYYCPFGPDWCGKNDPCPLHDQISAVMQHNSDFLKGTRLSVFQAQKKPQLAKKRK